MALHFSKEELKQRQLLTIKAMAAAGLDGLLMFRQESMYYLTGYDTFGYVFFQCLYLGADGTLTLLTRAPDLLQAKHTSVIPGHPDLGRRARREARRGAARDSRRARLQGKAARASNGKPMA